MDCKDASGYLAVWREISPTFRLGDYRRTAGCLAVGWREISPTFRLGDYRRAAGCLAVGWREQSPTFRLGDYRRAADCRPVGWREISPTFRLGDCNKSRRVLSLLASGYHQPSVWGIAALQPTARQLGATSHFRAAYSFFAPIRTGRSASASFQDSKKSSYALRAFSMSPETANARARPRRASG